MRFPNNEQPITKKKIIPNCSRVGTTVWLHPPRLMKRLKKDLDRNN